MASALTGAAAGVPTLLHPPVGQRLEVLTADAPGATGGTASGKWGIFDKAGVPVLLPDSVASFEFKKDWRISEYPQEGGAFQSYNKVETPFDVRLRLTKGGNDSARVGFFNALERVAASLELYDVVSPEKTYISASIVHIDYRRMSGQGVGLITADVWLHEVRVGAHAAFSNTKSPSGADAENGGTVQAQPTPASQATTIRNELRTGSW